MRHFILVLILAFNGCTKEPPKLRVFEPHVELDAFSGRPNPTWVVPAAEIDSLNALLRNVEPASKRDVPQNLGFRGFLLSDSRTNIRLYVVNGFLIQLENDHVVATWSDNGIWAALVRSARVHGFGGVVDKRGE